MSFFHAILFGVPTQPRMTNKPRATWVQSVDLCAPLCHVLLTTMLQVIIGAPNVRVAPLGHIDVPGLIRL